MPGLRQRKKEAQPSEIKADSESVNNGTNGLSVFSHLLLVVLLITLAAATFAYYRSPISAEQVRLPPKVELEKYIKGRSGVLDKGDRILVGLAGPESIEIDEHGNLYTGLLDGRLVKVHPSATGAIGEGLVEDILKGHPIKGVNAVDGHLRPRPLGLRLHQGYLYIIDAFYGLYSLNLSTKEIKILVAPDSVQPSMKFPNDLDITKNGEYIYFTDSSHKWHVGVLYNDVLEGSCTGRFFRYEVKTGRIKVLASKLCFANGVQLNEDESVALVSETTRFRVLFMDTKTGKVIHHTLLPGMPDNIRKSGAKTGGYWVAMPLPRTELFNFMMEYPFIRQIAVGMFSIGQLRYVAEKKIGLAVKIDDDGNIVDAVFDKTGRVSSTVSEIYETDDGTVFAASYKEPYMVKGKK